MQVGMNVYFQLRFITSLEDNLPTTTEDDEETDDLSSTIS